MKNLNVFFIVLSFSIQVLAGPNTVVDVGAAVQWPNDPFNLPIDSANVGPVDLARASKVQTQLQNLYANEFNLVGQPNHVLEIVIDWMKPYFGAFSTLSPQHNNSSLVVGNVTAWGGYIRVPEMTDLALATTLCHELGHHFGGVPRQQQPLPDWSSAEGQADFYAATVCLPRWLNVATSEQKPSAFHPDIVQKCKSSLPCLMVAQAGFEFVRVIHRYSYQNLPALSMTTPDLLKVSQTLTNTYPTYQCRLDTFIRAAESAALNRITVRPACWFRE